MRLFLAASFMEEEASVICAGHGIQSRLFFCRAVRLSASLALAQFREAAHDRQHKTIAD